jgi:hypothetical protein
LARQPGPVPQCSVHLVVGQVVLGADIVHAHPPGQLPENQRCGYARACDYGLELRQDRPAAIGGRARSCRAPA